MTASRMDALMANIFPNITSVQTLDNVTRCTAQSSVPSSHLSSHHFKGVFFGSDIDNNDNYNHDPYSDMPRLSLVDKACVIGMLFHSSVVPRLIFSMRRRYEAVVAAFGGSTQC